MTLTGILCSFDFLSQRGEPELFREMTLYMFTKCSLTFVDLEASLRATLDPVMTHMTECCSLRLR